MEADDEFLDRALKGFTMFALHQGEVCTCPSRALGDTTTVADLAVVSRLEGMYESQEA